MMPHWTSHVIGFIILCSLTYATGGLIVALTYRAVSKR